MCMKMKNGNSRKNEVGTLFPFWFSRRILVGRNPKKNPLFLVFLLTKMETPICFWIIPIKKKRKLSIRSSKMIEKVYFASNWIVK